MNKQELVEFGERVKQIRKHLDITQRDFAQSIKISGSFLSEIESGKTKASLEFIRNISTLYNINLPFLLHGTGDMFIDRENLVTLRLDEYGEYSDKILDLLHYMRCSPLVKMAVLEFFTKYFYTNEEIIKRDIENNRANDNGGYC